MVFLSKANRKRTPRDRALRFCIGVAAVALIVCALWLIPYDIIREERFRLYGETRTTGVVTGVTAAPEPVSESQFVVEYKYVDNDGFARQGAARMPASKWGAVRRGSRITVLYVRARPDLTRVEGEIEPPFQTWLRGLLH